MMEGSLGVLGREVFRILGIIADDIRGNLISWRDELGHGMNRVSQDDEKRTKPRLAQIECGLKDRHRKIAPSRPADRFTPDRELAGDVEQPPACVAEAEHEVSRGEDLDLL